MFTLKKKRRNSRKGGFSLVEVMVAVGIGGAVMYFSSSLIKAPEQLEKQAASHLTSESLAFSSFKAFAKEVEQSQLSKSGFLNCGLDTETLLSSRSNEAKEREINLEDLGTQLNFPYSNFTTMGMPIQESGKQYLLLASEQKFQEGDWLIVTEKADSRIGAVFQVSAIPPTGKRIEVVQVSSLGNAPCTINELDTSFETLVNLKEAVKIDQIYVVSYQVVENKGQKSLKRLLWRRSSDSGVESNLVEPLEFLKIQEKWTPFGGRELGKVAIDLDLRYKKKQNDGSYATKNMHSQAGYEFTASTRTNFDLELESFAANIANISCKVELDIEDTKVLAGEKQKFYQALRLTGVLVNREGISFPYLETKLSISSGSTLYCCSADTVVGGVLPQGCDEGANLSFAFSGTNFTDYICLIKGSSFYTSEGSAKVTIVQDSSKISYYDNDTKQMVSGVVCSANTLGDIKGVKPQTAVTKSLFSCSKEPYSINAPSSISAYGIPIYPAECILKSDPNNWADCPSGTFMNVELHKVKFYPANLFDSSFSDGIVECN